MDLQVRDVIESKTVFETKDGKIVETSAFPFWRLAFNTPPQEVSIFYKVEMNCKRLDMALILGYTNLRPDNQGT